MFTFWLIFTAAIIAIAAFIFVAALCAAAALSEREIERLSAGRPEGDGSAAGNPHSQPELSER